MHYTERGIEIDAPVERVFDLLGDFENVPKWLKTVSEVRQVASGHSRWRAEGPRGDGVQWETETTAFEPDHRIAWRSVRGDIRTEGEIVLEETRRGTTWLRVVLGYDEDDPRSYDQIRDAFGNQPGRQLEAGLQRLAHMAESRRNRQQVRDEPRMPAYHEDREPRRARFEPAMRDDRRDEMDRRSQYVEVPGRDERRMGDRRAHERRHGDVDRDYYYRPEVGVRPNYEDEAERDEPRRRYAMTPREREEEMRRQGDYDNDSRDVLKRGIDRLMDDDPPSGRWHRW